MKINKTKYELISNILCLLLLTGAIIYLGINWTNIPEKIPGHYNFAGEVDRWGNKKELLFVPILAWVLYLGMSVVERFPKLWNTGVEVTEENKERVYPILKKLLVTVKLLVVVVFTFLTINSIQGKDMPIWFVPVFLIIMFGSIIYFTIKAYKAK